MRAVDVKAQSCELGVVMERSESGSDGAGDARRWTGKSVYLADEAFSEEDEASHTAKGSMCASGAESLSCELGVVMERSESSSYGAGDARRWMWRRTRRVSGQGIQRGGGVGTHG
jgi:hypothetical protein